MAKPTTMCKCNICGHICANASQLQRHNTVHTAVKDFQCTLCYKRFKSKGSLQRHIKTHGGEKPFQCHLCHKNFTRGDILKRHFQDIHIDVKPFQCHSCEKSFLEQVNLDNHIKRTHSGAYPIRCNLCNMSFTREYSLNRHISRVHTVRVSKCNECIAYYQQLLEYIEYLCLWNSNNPIRPPPRPFICSFCYRTFTEERLLLSHLSEHKSETALPCTNCHLKFGDIQSLIDHVCRGGPSSKA